MAAQLTVLMRREKREAGLGRATGGSSVRTDAPQWPQPLRRPASPIRRTPPAPPLFRASPCPPFALASHLRARLPPARVRPSPRHQVERRSLASGGDRAHEVAAHRNGARAGGVAREEAWGEGREERDGKGERGVREVREGREGKALASNGASGWSEGEGGGKRGGLISSHVASGHSPRGQARRSGQRGVQQWKPPWSQRSQPGQRSATSQPKHPADTGSSRSSSGSGKRAVGVLSLSSKRQAPRQLMAQLGSQQQALQVGVATAAAMIAVPCLCASCAVSGRLSPPSIPAASNALRTSPPFAVPLSTTAAIIPCVSPDKCQLLGNGFGCSLVNATDLSCQFNLPLLSGGALGGSLVGTVVQDVVLLPEGGGEGGGGLSQSVLFGTLIVSLSSSWLALLSNPPLHAPPFYPPIFPFLPFHPFPLPFPSPLSSLFPPSPPLPPSLSCAQQDGEASALSSSLYPDGLLSVSRSATSLPSQLVSPFPASAAAAAAEGSPGGGEGVGGAEGAASSVQESLGSTQKATAEEATQGVVLSALASASAASGVSGAQLGSQRLDAVGLCFEGDAAAGSGGRLLLGDAAAAGIAVKPTSSTPMLGQPEDQLYYVAVASLQVAAQPLPLPGMTWESVPEQGRGAVISSSAPLTALPPTAYNAFIKKVLLLVPGAKLTATAPPTLPVQLDCYDLPATVNIS
ncbi:unnamed protein product [Closterium sp. NIES-54]